MPDQFYSRKAVRERVMKKFQKPSIKERILERFRRPKR